MNEQHEKYFLDEFPDMFVAWRTGEPFTPKDRAAGLVFGLECGDGWFTLIDTLCKSIRCHMKNYNRGKADEDTLQVKVLQVKEKFGGLRFYVESADEYVYGLIDLAESMSYEICEYCGGTEDVQRTDQRWIRYYCKNCRDREGYGAAEDSTPIEVTAQKKLDEHFCKNKHIPNQETLDSMEKTERGEGLTEVDDIDDI